MKRHLLLFAALIAALAATARTESVKSPDGQILVTVSDEGGKPAYSVGIGQCEFLQKSPLGLIADFGDLSQGLTLSAVKERSIKDSYTVPTIKQRNVVYEANEAVMTFQKDGRDALQIVWRVSNRDVAFRYIILQPKRDIYAAVVKEEKTGFILPDGTTTFLCPQAGPMGGFAGTSPSYETHYTADAPTGTNGWGEGFTFPCLFKINALEASQDPKQDSKKSQDPKQDSKKTKTDAKDPKPNTQTPAGWLLVSETGVSGAYCGSRLLNIAGNHYQIGFPQEKENNGNGTVSPGVSLPFSTPWRTLTLGQTLAPIMETTVAWDVVEEMYPASREFIYGRGTWSWIMKMDPSCNYDEQKRYIDFAADMNYQTVLIDALWDTQIGYDKMPELVRYAATKGVGIYLWYNSNGYWNHAPQGPRGKMFPAINRKKEMQWLKKIGVRGMKIDFFGGDKQQTIQLYEDILSDANDYGLNVIFHGCTLPRGWERMYPNFVASEAVRASENLHFGQGECDREAFAATIHPFIRNTVASMDFGGSALNKQWGHDGQHGNHRRTSDVFALATAVMFQAPVQHFALAPNNLQDAPQWAIDFMKEVPTLWDEVRYIDGYPGRYCILARRTADRWYIAGINAEEQPLNITLDLAPFNLPETFSLYSDDPQLNGSLKLQKQNKKKNLKLTIPQNGAILIK